MSDHTDDIFDGSDGNLDITHGSDFITVSWTKFHYSCRRTDPGGATGGHQFSSLIGRSDSNAVEDDGHLEVTFHHDWWADNVVERMPRVRFGKVPCLGQPLYRNLRRLLHRRRRERDIRDENDVFIAVNAPTSGAKYGNAASVVQSVGNLDEHVTGTNADFGGAAFIPPYAYPSTARATLKR